MPKQARSLHRDAPASVGLVKEVRNELRAEIRAVEHRLNFKIKGLDSRFVGLGSNFLGLESKVEAVAAVSKETLAAVHRCEVLIEEQRGDNRIVLDAIVSLSERQTRLEQRLDSKGI